MRQFDAHPPDMALDFLLGRRLTRDDLDRHLVLLRRSVAVLRHQGAVAGLSEWVARFDFGWAIRLTRRPRSRQGALPFENW